MMSHDSFEWRVFRFEQAWRQSGPAEIAAELAGFSTLDDPAHHRLLVELICVDLEYRWKAKGSVERLRLDHYVEQFPALVSLDCLPVELIGEEYRVRCRWGERPSHAEILSRFPGRDDQVRLELLRIDAELEAEAGRRPTPQSPSRARAPEEWDELEPDVPRLSHQDFRLRRLIGAGRMGKVYEASQRGADRDVALKFLRKSFLQHPGVVRRFLGEARTIARLRHPNIVGTQGLGRTPAGAYFIVMDLVNGPNLAQVAGRRVVAVDEAVRWVRETCEALEHSHERGIVHCDLKPANLLLDRSGRIRVTDFGLARTVEDDASWTAEVEGTAPFMAPEQVDRGWGPIDQRTDVYGIGAVLFALLTGKPPFLGGRLPDVLAAVASAIPVVSPARVRAGLPVSLSDLCLKCLAKPQEARFQTVREVRVCLADWLVAKL